MRLSGAILMVVAVFHLLYMQFISPGGVAAIDQAVIVARWTDPVWGLFWRTFDLLLLVFSLTHGSNGLRSIINAQVRSDNRRSLAKTILYLAYFVLMILGVTIIFSFKSEV